MRLVLKHERRRLEFLPMDRFDEARLDQLGKNIVPLAGVVLGGINAILGVLAWAAMTVAFQPMLHFYSRSPFWGLALPVIGLFYAAFTIDSAVQHWRGRGGMWKGRAQAMA